MDKLRNNLKGESPRNKKDTSSPKTKSFGYQILGFGSGGASRAPYQASYMVVAGGGGAGGSGFIQ